MIFWRLISEGMARLEELETTWSLDDVLKATAVLNIQAATIRTMRKTE